MSDDTTRVVLIGPDDRRDFWITSNPELDPKWLMGRQSKRARLLSSRGPHRILATGKVKSRSQNVQLMIANCLLLRWLRVGLLITAPEKKGRSTVVAHVVVRSLQSDSSNNNHEKRAEFVHSARIQGGNSLHSRLHGGGRGIRTPGTVSRTSVFKTDCFNHSHIPPRELVGQY